MFSLNMVAASTFAGLRARVSYGPPIFRTSCNIVDLTKRREEEMRECSLRARVGIVQQTLHTGQDCRHVISRRPPILQNIQTQLSVAVNVRVEHFGYEADGRWFVGVGVGECEGESE